MKKAYDELNTIIFDVLSETQHNADQIILQNDMFSIKEGPVSSLFHLLFELNLTENQAKDYFRNILDSKAEMEERLGRNVGFQVAALDYLSNIQNIIKKPKIIELDSYETKCKLAVIDELTGLYNRRYAQSFLEKEMHRSHRYGFDLSILFLDIDDFKKINDNYGHYAGDRVLVNLSGLLKSFLRSEDIAARYGGEEFLVVMPQTDTEGAKTMAERLLTQARTTVVHENTRVTFSGGIATYPHHGSEINELLNKADEALYMSKMKGKDQIRIINENKRTHKRYPVHFDVMVSEETCADEDKYTIIKGKTKDISVDGVSFELNKNLKPGETVKIRIATEEDSSIYEIMTRIVWSKKIHNNTVFRFGAEYASKNKVPIEELLSTI